MDALLNLLTQRRAFSREALCAQLCIPEKALTEQLEALAGLGYRIGTDGFVTLLPSPGSLLPGYLAQALTTQRFGCGEILYAPEMGSTNAVLKQAAAARTLPEGSLAVCDWQTAGRGRMQRVWEGCTPGESLTCSLLLKPALPRERLQWVTLGVAVAAAEALASFHVDARIKWPNDGVIHGRKCLGVLCELVTDPQGVPCVVVGTGFNVNQSAFAGELADKATSLRLETGVPCDRQTLLCRYLAGLEPILQTLEGAGLAGLMPRYAARSATLHSRVRVIGAGETFEGMAEELDGTGALLVRDDAGALRTVWSGDVSVRGVTGYV